MPQLDFQRIDKFTSDLSLKVHHLAADQMAVALSNTAVDNTDELLSDVVQIAYTNLSSRQLGADPGSSAGGTYTMKRQNITMTSTGGTTGPFRWVVIYNDAAPQKNLVGYYDWGSALTLENGDSLTIQFDATSGLLQVAPAP
jgi:hypothetical protein